MITTTRIWNVKKSVFVVWGSVLAGSVLVSLFTSSHLPSLADVALRSPLTILTASLLVAAALLAVLKIPLRTTWQIVVPLLPASIGIGTLLSLLGVWNDGSGVVVLPWKSLAAFVFTGGVIPASIGPESLLRCSLLALAVLSVFAFRRKKEFKSKSILIGVLVWFASAIILLIPSWVALGSAAIHGMPLRHGQDAVRVLGKMHTDSYWSSFQADRFFTGIGDEVVNASNLSTSAALLLVSLLILFVLAFNAQRKGLWVSVRVGLQKMYENEAIFLVSGALGGFLLGIRGNRFSWSGVNLMAFVLLVLVSAAFAVMWTYAKELESRDVFFFVALLAGGLLGWPVLILVFALFFITWLLEQRGFEWNSSAFGRAVSIGVLMLVMVALGGVVGARSPLYPHALTGWITAWALLAAGAHVLRTLSEEKKKDLKRVGVIALISIAGFLPLMSLYVFAALGALYFLALYHSYSRGRSWSTDVIRAALVFGLVGSVVSYVALL